MTSDPKPPASPEPATVPCEAAKPGSVCGATAIVRKTRHEFDTLIFQGRGGYQYKLRASYHDIECPTCGRRVQAARPEAD